MLAEDELKTMVQGQRYSQLFAALYQFTLNQPVLSSVSVKVVQEAIR